MYYFKKICLYSCIILLIISLYNDFTKGSNSHLKSDTKKDSFIINELSVIKLKVNPGETILSISERINGQKLENISIDEIIADFSSVNPGVNIHELTSNKYYYFPIYE